MQIRGQLHRITDLRSFVDSFVRTGGRPSTGFAPFGRAPVHLATIPVGGTGFPVGDFPGGFLPGMSLKTDANSRGEFSFTVPAGVAKSRGRLLVFRAKTMPAPRPGMPPLPILDPIYRSAPFEFSDVSPQEQQTVRHIFIRLATTPPERGVSQQDLDAVIAQLREELELDKLRATMMRGKVSVSAGLRGGDVRFSAFVRGSTSADLERIIEVKAGDIDIDLPGPDLIVGLCADEGDIERRIREGMGPLSKQVSRKLLAQLDQEAPGLTDRVTISVWRARFVRTGTRTIRLPIGLGGQRRVEIPIFTLVPDAAFGVPKRLF